MIARMFAIGPGDRGSITGRVLKKPQKLKLDDSMLNTQHYKLSGAKQGKEYSLSRHFRVIAIEKGTFGLLLTTTGLK